MKRLDYRYRPTSYTEETSMPEFGIECFYTKTPKCYAILYSGRSTKHVFHYQFANETDMFNRINGTIENIVNRETRKRNEKLKLKSINDTFKASNYYRVGDIVVNSWGYDQTNVEFYEVVEVLNKKIKVREISQVTDTSKETGNSMACYVLPNKGSFIDENDDAKPMLLTLKLDSNAECRISSPKSYYYFHKWSGTAEYCSWYA